MLILLLVQYCEKIACQLINVFCLLAVSVLLTAPRDIYHCVEDVIVWLLLSYIHEITDNLLIHVVQLNATVWRNSEHG